MTDLFPAEEARTITLLIKIHCGPATRFRLFDDTDKGLAMFIRQHLEAALSTVSTGEQPLVRVFGQADCCGEADDIKGLKIRVGLK